LAIRSNILKRYVDDYLVIDIRKVMLPFKLNFFYHCYLAAAVRIAQCHVAVQVFAAMYLAEMITLRVVPVVAIALLNALIVSRVTRITRDRKRRRRRHVPLLTVDPGTATRHLSPGAVAIDTTAINIQSSRASLSCDSVRRASLDERNLQLTIILILVSSTYVLFYLPVLVHFVVFKMMRSGIVRIGLPVLDVFGNYAKALHVAGFAINFLLYTVSGRVFREQLVALMRRCRCPPLVPPGAAATMSTHAAFKLSAV